MYLIAVKMLVGDRGKYLGIIMGLTFASLLITQQSSIFTGLMTRTYSFIGDLSQPDIWVMDPKVQYIDDSKPLQDTELFRVRGVKGVEWAVPLYKGLLKARLENGAFQVCNVLGIDDATLVGGPPQMIEGSLSDLRRQDAIIVNDVGARTRLAKRPTEAGAKPIPLKVGDTLEVNDHRAVVVGICRVSRTFQSQPVIYTTYSRATSFAPGNGSSCLLSWSRRKQGRTSRRSPQKSGKTQNWRRIPPRSSKILLIAIMSKIPGSHQFRNRRCPGFSSARPSPGRRFTTSPWKISAISEP